MKKVLLIPIILVLFPCLFTLSSCKKVEDDITIETSDISLKLFLDGNTLDGECSQEITAQETAIAPLQFYPIYQKVRDGEQYYEISDIMINNKPTDYTIDEVNHCILPQMNLIKGERSTITIKYKIHLKTDDYKLGINDRIYALTKAYPYCAYYCNGYSPRPFTEIGESECFDMVNFNVSLKVKSNYVVATSGIERSRIIEDSYSITEYSQDNIRDFAIFCSPILTLRSTKIGNTTLRYYFYDDKSFQDNLDISAEALTFFNDIFSSYDYDMLSIVRGPLSASGMEYSCLALVNDKLSKKEAKEVIVHEIAHQWWFLKVANDQAFEPWIDESLAEFSTAYFLLKRGDGDVFQTKIDELEKVASSRMLKKQQLKIGLSIYEYDQNDYIDCVYKLGSLLWIKLYEIYGVGIIEELKNLSSTFSSKILSKEELTESIGDGLTEYFNSWLSGSVAFAF